uniref:Uncharacterized protein n=1 Tax=Podarcis muralis TaxID=64176 RepID=A0A670INM9_PODMU
SLVFSKALLLIEMRQERCLIKVAGISRFQQGLCSRIQKTYTGLPYLLLIKCLDKLQRNGRCGGEASRRSLTRMQCCLQNIIASFFHGMLLNI